VGLLTRKQTPARTVPSPTPDRACTGHTRAGRACGQWAKRGLATCHAHTPPPALTAAVVGEQSNTRGSLTAAGMPISFKGAAWKDWKPGDRAWQQDAWRLYDITGQLRFVARSVANSMSLCRLYVAELDEAGNIIGETEDPEIAALAAVPLGTGPQKAENIQSLGLQLFVVGEAYLVAESKGAEDGGDLWYPIAGREVKKTGSTLTVVRPPQHGGGVLEYRDGVDSLERIWTPHPADSNEPDAPVRSAIPDLRKLEAIRKRMFAELDSRLTGAGVWFLPDNLDFPASDDNPGGVEGFYQHLTEVMSTAIQDRSSASAVAPNVVPVPADLLDKIKPPVTFWSELDAQLLPMEEATFKSLAQSLDAPVEMMMGTGESNHWSAWLIAEETIKTHYEPPLNRIADAITRMYLHGAIAAIRPNVDARRFAYAFDTGPLRVRADRSTDALALHERHLLSDDATVEAANFPVEEMPDQQEKLRRLAEELFRSAPNIALLDPQLRELVGLSTDIPAIGPATEPVVEPEPVVEVEEPRALPEQPDEAPPPGDGLTAACEIAVLRALELAGGRLVPHRERGDTPRHQLHTRVAAADRGTADKALADAWTHLPVIAQAFNLPVDRLHILLNGYVMELITRGREHERGLLAALVAAARTGVR